MSALVTTLLLLLPTQASSFSPATQLPSVSHGLPNINLIRPTTVAGRPSSPLPLAAKKKRRRRKKDAPLTPTAKSDELPDFDDDEAILAEKDPVRSTKSAVAGPSSARMTATPIKRGAGLSTELAEEVGGNVDGLDEDTILEAMRGKLGGDSWQPPRSIQDTIGDRSLEKLMDFDRMIAQDGGGQGEGVELPEFDDVIARRKRKEAVEEGAVLVDTEGMGKKAARKAQRRAAAMRREAEMMEEEDSSPFADLNFQKVLENGAWLGIGLLVLWEIFINSPFFERAAPLIPVVYDKTPPGI